MLGQLQRARRKVLTRIVPFKCILGDENNNPYTGESGYYWVRRFDRSDENGNSTPGTPFRVRSGTALVVPRGGRQVWVGTGLDGHLTVLGFVHEDLVAAGVDPRAAQPNDPYRAWIRLKDIQNFRALPVGTGNVPSMKVQVRQLFYYTETGDLVRYNGTNADTHIDLTAYVPADGFQRYAVLWLRTYDPNGDGDIQVTVSTPIDSLDSDLSFDDLQECASLSDADTIPIQAFRLADAQTSLKLDDTVDVDLRQFINMPQVYGFPNDVSRAYRVHENHSVIMPEVVTISSGGGVEIQDSGVLVILDIEPAESGGGSVTDTGITQLTGDVTAGPGSGSQAATLANTTVTPGSYTYTALTVDSKGRLTAASSGTAPVTSVGLSEDTDFLEVGGSPVTSTGTITLNRTDGLAANRVVATPDNATGKVTTRALVDRDIPDTLTLTQINDTNGNEELIFTATASAVNELTVKNAAANTNPQILASGSDTNIGISILPKGSGQVVVGGTVTSDADITDNLGSSALKFKDAFLQHLVFEDATTPSTPASGDLIVYSESVAGTSSVMAIEDSSSKRQLTPMHIRLVDSKTANTAGGTSSNTTWNARDLNTEEYDPDDLATISGNKFVLVAGKYKGRAYSTFLGGSAANSSAQNRIFNVTTSTEVNRGENATAVTNSAAIAVVDFELTSNGTDEYRVETYTTVGRATNGLGLQLNNGNTEKYTVVVLEKIG